MQPAATHDRRLHFSLYAVTFVTGMIDAAGFIGMGRVFTANMTGNVVLLAFAVAGVPELSIARSVAALLAFLVGAVLAGRLFLRMGTNDRHRWLGIALLFESICTLSSATLAWTTRGHLTPESPAMLGVIALSALGLGMRNGTIRKLQVPELTTTVLTLTIAGFASESTLGGGANPNWHRRLGSVSMMFLGAATGALLCDRALWGVLAIAGVIALVVACLLLATGTAPNSEPQR